LRGPAALALILSAGLSVGGSTFSYTSGSGDVAAAARQEKKLVIYSVVHADAAVKDLLSVFKRRYPFIDISNSDDDGARTYKRFKAEIAADKPSADFIWSSAMDLQEKLINDGLSLPYATPEMPYLPGWSHWQDLGYGVTLEPIAIVYNKRFLSSQEMPRSHPALRELLARESKHLERRVALYNPETSEVGMLLLSQDIRITRDSWDLFDALGNTKAELYNTSRDMLLNIISGKQWIGYDVVASYALEMQKTHPELEVVFPADYTLALSRVAFVTASARHPSTAKLFWISFSPRKDRQFSAITAWAPCATT